jgi:hypothetical protein
MSKDKVEFHIEKIQEEILEYQETLEVNSEVNSTVDGYNSDEIKKN